MTISYYSATVPVLKQMLSALSDVLKKAKSTHNSENSIRPLYCSHAYFQTCCRWYVKYKSPAILPKVSLRALLALK